MSDEVTSPCRSILMVGTDAQGKGGISSVIGGYLEGGLFERFHGQYVVTHRNGGAWTKLSAAIHGWFKVATLLKTLDAPLVHIQAASRASFWRKWVVCLLSRLAGRPYILHVHGAEFLEFYAKESGPFARYCIRSTLAHAAVVIALSEQWRAGLLKICPAAAVEVLSNAVPLPELSGVENSGNRAPKALFLGEISKRKGVSDLVRAFARLPRKGGGVSTLVCGGTGAVPEVLALARDLGVADRVSFPGWLDAEGKRTQLASAALFVLPSYAEGMPMALLEAMSWGLPVIATSVGGIPQLIEHDRNGLLVAPGNIAALSAAMARLIADPGLRDRLGAAARATVESGYAPHVMLERLGRIYRRFGIEARCAAPAPGRAPAPPPSPPP